MLILRAILFLFHFHVLISLAQSQSPLTCILIPLAEAPYPSISALSCSFVTHNKSDSVPSQRSKSDQFGQFNFQEPKQHQQQQHQKDSPNGSASSAPGSHLNQSRSYNTTTNKKGPTSPRSPPPQPVGVLPEPRSFFSPSRRGGILPTAAHARAAGASPASTPPRPYRPTNSADFNFGGSGAPKRSPRVTAQENLRKL